MHKKKIEPLITMHANNCAVVFHAAQHTRWVPLRRMSCAHHIKMSVWRLPCANEDRDESGGMAVARITNPLGDLPDARYPRLSTVRPHVSDGWRQNQKVQTLQPPLPGLKIHARKRRRHKMIGHLLHAPMSSSPPQNTEFVSVWVCQCISFSNPRAVSTSMSVTISSFQFTHENIESSVSPSLLLGKISSDTNNKCPLLSQRFWCFLLLFLLFRLWNTSGNPTPHLE